jgi:hypothetical protein
MTRISRSFFHFILFLIFTLKIAQSNSKPLGENSCKTFECKDDILRKRPSHKELCKFCDITLPIVRYLIAKNDTEHFHEIVSYICQELKLADKIVCDMVVKTYQVTHFISC